MDFPMKYGFFQHFSGSSYWTGEVLKVYISESSNPAAIASAACAGCLQVDFQPRGFTLNLDWRNFWCFVVEHGVVSLW